MESEFLGFAFLLRMVCEILLDSEKWWPRGIKRSFVDPITGGRAEQMLMRFYNEATMWRCTVCGWNEVYGVYACPVCRKCSAPMKIREQAGVTELSRGSSS